MDNILNEFLKDKKKEKVKKHLIYSMIKELDDIYKQDSRVKKIRKGIGHKNRKNTFIKNLKINFLMNCLRKHFYIKSKTFEEEFSIENTTKVSSQNQEKIKSLEEALEFHELMGEENEVEKIIKQIENLKISPVEKIKKRNDLCTFCEKDMIIDQGMYLCMFCGSQGRSLENQSYFQSTSLSGTSTVPEDIKMIQLKVNKQTEEKFKEKARSLVESVDNLLRNVDYLGEIDIYSTDLWKIASDNQNKDMKQLKIITARYILNEARRRKIKNLKGVLKDIRNYLRIKQNLDHLLKSGEEEQNKVYKLNALLSESDKNIKEEIKQKLNITNPNELEMAAIVKFILFKVRKLSSKESEEKILNTSGLRGTKYSNQFNKIKKLK